ncbi:MAG: hypothetical protein H6742_18085 [Alphaproteobacteria bacterium]|nr:hypothetical protein [Alphaproteobacteria bacterium]
MPAPLLALLLTACAAGGDTGAGWTPCRPGQLCPVMGTGELGFNGDGLPARETRLASPTSVRETPDGRVMVVDYSNMRLRTVDPDGRVSTLAGNGVHAYSELGAQADQSPLENPIDALWGPDGLLYVLPQHEARVLRVEPGGELGCVAGSGYLGDAGSGIEALRAELGYLDGIAVADDGTIFLSDSSFGRVRRIGPDGLLDNVLGTHEAGAPDEGHGPDVALRTPGRLLLDGDWLYVADTGGDRVLALDTRDLQAVVVAGTGTGGDGGPAREAALDGPVGLALAPDGGLLISELGADRIRHVDAAGIIHTVAGGGPCPAAPLSGASPLEFCMTDPAGMAWTDDGDLLIAERGGHRVLRWLGAADVL